MDLNKTYAQAVVEIFEAAAKFESSIVIRTEDKCLDAKSILGLSYTVLHSKKFILEIHGRDEAEAKTEMTHVFWKNNLPVEIL